MRKRTTGRVGSLVALHGRGPRSRNVISFTKQVSFWFQPRTIKDDWTDQALTKKTQSYPGCQLSTFPSSHSQHIMMLLNAIEWIFEFFDIRVLFASTGASERRVSFF